MKYWGEGCDVSLIGYDSMLGYVAERLKVAMPGTIKVELAYLSGGFKLLERSGKVKRPIFPTIRVQNARQGFFEDHELKEVCRFLHEDYVPFIYFLHFTGWRPGEAKELRWTAIDWNAGIVRLEVRTTKNKDGRSYPFKSLPALERLLRDQRDRTTALEAQKSQVIPWVFWRKRNGVNPIGNYLPAWRKAREKAGYQDRQVRDSRRTAVRRLERAGVPRSVAMKLTGHKTQAIYDRYAIVNESDLTEGVQKLARLMDPKKERNEENS